MSDSSNEGSEYRSSKKRDLKDDAKTTKKLKTNRDNGTQSKSSKTSKGSSSGLKDEDTKARVERTKAVNESFKSKSVGLADFQKLKEIGRGAIGKVYVVRLKGTDELYAMKVIKKYDMVQRNKVKRILTEREILATADHPFIVSLYYSFQSQHSLVFIMEYCAGGEFYRLIQRQPFRCLKEEDARFYAAEVLSALEYLHKMGFIYRDLKPENVLVHASGHLVLTDFDLSKGSSAPVQPKLITKMFSGSHGVTYQPDVVTNSFVGTEEYLAPEVVTGTGHNATVDWWTFGILLYEMIYGTTPFRGTTRDDTFTNIRKTYIDFPEHKRGGVSKECKKLLKHLLERDPTKRLGAVGGATDIKDHAFFEPMKTKWSILHQLKPPIIPTIPALVIDEKLQQEEVEEEIDTTKLSKDHLWKDFGNLDLVHEESEEKEREKEKEKDRDRKERSRARNHDRESDSDSEENESREKKRSRKEKEKLRARIPRDTDSESEESEAREKKRSKKSRAHRDTDSESEESEGRDKRRSKRETKTRAHRDTDSESEESEDREKKRSKKEKRTHRDTDSGTDESEGREKKRSKKDRSKDDEDDDRHKNKRKRDRDDTLREREDKDRKEKKEKKERGSKEETEGEKRERKEKKERAEKEDDRDESTEKEPKKEKRDGERREKSEKTDSSKKEKREKTDAEKQEKKERKEKEKKERERETRED